MELVVQTGSQAGMVFPVDRPAVRIGRGSRNDVVLLNAEVSRYHAEIGVEEEQPFIRDLGSVNGTYVDGHRLQANVAVPLSPGSQIRMAGSVLSFQEARDTAPAASDGLPALESTAAKPGRQLQPLSVVMLASAALLLLVLVALAATLLSTGERVAVIAVPTASPAGFITPAATPLPTERPSAPTETPLLPTVGVPTVELLPTPSPLAEATAASSTLSNEALAWLEQVEGELYIGDELILKFKPGVTDRQAQAFLDEQGLALIDKIEALGICLVRVEDGSAAEALDRLVGHPLLEWVNLNGIISAFGEPNDAQWGRQWNMWAIHAPQGWDRSTGSGDVVVAILDSGIDLNHPDLRDKIVDGYDFIDDDTTPQDARGHGTHVAGIAAAFGNNREGVAGVSWGSRIQPVKVLDADGQCTAFDVASGITWAADDAARVMNLSLGFRLPAMLSSRGIPGGDVLREAVDYAHAQNVLVVAAAGNSYEEGNLSQYPAAYPHVLAVASTNDEDRHAHTSNAGTYVDVAAPGGERSQVDDPHAVYSTMPTYEVALNAHGIPARYGAMSGTSMAAPHVAGLAALIWSVNDGLSNDQVQAIIESTADDLGPPGWDGCFGAGRINVERALQAAAAGDVPTGGPREHGVPLGTFCQEFTTVPENPLPIPLPTINWSLP